MAKYLFALFSSKLFSVGDGEENFELHFFYNKEKAIEIHNPFEMIELLRHFEFVYVSGSILYVCVCPKMIFCNFYCYVSSMLISFIKLGIYGSHFDCMKVVGSVLYL